ncbi:MAG: TIGR03790 family protein [Pirellulales bacterium]|nr:TIGR03790 family protein [Pirellulales bacterium]
MRTAKLTRFIAVVCLAVVAALPCRAELLPEEVAIIAVRGSRESEGLAKYYAQQRKIPSANICTVDMPRGETLDREKWQWAVRPEIAKWITENDPEARLKCLVTTFDVPLKIGPASADDLQPYRSFLEHERLQRYARLNEILSAFSKLAPASSAAGGAAPQGTAEAASPDAKAKLNGLKQDLEKALQAAQAEIAKLGDADERQRQQLEVQQLAGAVGGVNVLVGALGQKMAAEAEAAQSLRSDFDVLRGHLMGLAEAKGMLDQVAAAPERDALILAMIDRANGLTTSIAWLDEQLAALNKNETSASFDSELSLIMWPDGYELLRWQPNYLRAGYRGSALPQIRRTLMVSRIDAPTIVLAKGLIDAAIQAEESGLQGKAYFDARGLAKLDNTPHAPGSYEDFDRALLITARGIEEQTDLEAVLDEQPALFQAGQCPQAALYCGWYSLGKYVDAFDWAPGAVAYHLASSEAVTLHKADSQVWCKRMLEDGVAATIGPVVEPYLFAFPRPEEFFALLLRGELTLVECYYETQPFNSWAMTLIGDPLYRPFKNRPMKGAQPAQKGAAQSQ